jgi:hypothetical protein
MMETRGYTAGDSVSEKQYRDQIDRLNTELAKLRADEGKARAAASKARSDASSHRAKIKPTTSPTMARSYESSARSADKRAESEDTKVAGAASKIADRTKKLNTAETNLARERQAAARKEEQSTQRRRREELDHAKRVARLSRPVVRHVHEIQQVPTPKTEELRLLYLTSNPGMNLRVDAEVGRVQRAVRGTLHRDYVEIELRPAATPQDLLDGLNDLRPHVVHFSGHGGDGAIVMDNGDVVDPQEREVSIDHLGMALGAVDRPPTLLVLNACDTVDAISDEVLSAVPLVIAMADSVLDEAAALFATQFYSAVASGQSVNNAYKQGVLAVKMGGLDDESWMIKLLNRDDVDPADVVLVRPPADAA